MAAGNVKAGRCEQLVQQLTLDEKISLLAGKNFWETVDIPRLDIPSIKVTDGPNGARGEAFFHSTPAACFPAAVALAATWDREMVRRIGNGLAEETRTKGASVLLGPTVCPHRSPLGGRNFESFSEDPLLAGKLAVSYIDGLQEAGVGATIKHFAANEQETRRFTMNVTVSERALREIYLKPFEIAIKEASPWLVMTSYNLVNGIHSDMNDFLLRRVLRQEWKFSGLVVSDWGGTNSVRESIEAGLDLEMPGLPNKRKLDSVRQEVESGNLDVNYIDACALRVLQLVEKGGKFEDPEIPAEKAVDTPAHHDLIREVGGAGIVLLKNEGNILPLQPAELKRIAVIGLAKECLAHGGGSASVTSHYKISPWEALEKTIGSEVELIYAQGAHTFRNLPVLQEGLTDLQGNPGLTISLFDTNDTTTAPMKTLTYPTGTYAPFTEPVKPETIKIQGHFTPSATGNHRLGFFSLGPATLKINGQVISEVNTNCDDGMAFLLGASPEQQCQFQFSAGTKYDVEIEAHIPTVRATGGLSLLEDMLGTRLTFMHEDEFSRDLLSEAVEVARNADIALVFVGNTPAWETEGVDMQTFELPAHGSQDKLVEAISAINPNVVVVNSTGVAKAMPWIDQVRGLVQAWFGGQEAGNSIVDVLLGKVNPGGKLPCTFPRSIEATPSFGNFPGSVEDLQVKYEEDIYIGYRHYDRHPEDILFPFGYGLSYTQFSIGDVKLQESVLQDRGHLVVQATVHNTGDKRGSEVVQVYVAATATKLDVPDKQLVSFEKVDLLPGESKTISTTLSYRSVAYFNPSTDSWVIEAGNHKILVGNSSRNIFGTVDFTVERDIVFEP